MTQNTVNLPSQKLFMIFLPLIVILGVFSLLSDHSKTETEVKDSAKVVAVTNNIVDAVDTDSDKVPDWEEIIWKTDPKKESTFGKPDREYIDSQIALSKNATSTTLGVINGSEDLAKELFNRYAALQASGELNSATIESMTADIAQNIQFKEQGKIYTIGEVKTFPSSNTGRLQLYASTLKKIYTQYSESYISQFPNVTLSPGDPQFTKTAASLSSHYEKFSREILAIQAPDEVATIHLEYANSIREGGEGLRLMSEVESEPLGGILGLKKYLDATDSQSIAINKLTEYLVSNGIVNVNLELF